MKSSVRIKHLLAAACFLAGFAATATAVEISGVKLDDKVTVAGKELQLNGGGVRTWAIFQVYVLGLYLPQKKSAVADVLALSGPRRVKMVFLREMNSEEFGEAFMKGLNANSDKAEKSKFVNQTVKMGEIFASIPSLKKGDWITCDWVPGSGMVIQVNDKKIGETLPDIGFYNAFLKIWLGEKPADDALKPKMLGL